MEKDLPDHETSYSREGTSAHELGERALNKGLDADVWVGAEINGIEVTDDMAEAVQVYVDFVMSLVEHEEDEMLLEQKFSLAKLNPPGPMFGTADAVVWHPRTGILDVVDYKNGRGVVVSADDPQFKYYGLGAMLHLMKRPEQIRIHVVQPRAFHPDGIIRSIELAFDELVEFKHELFERAERTGDPDAPLVVGEWCRFCKAQAVWPAQERHMVEVAQSEFSVEEPWSPPKPEALSLDQLRLVLERSSDIVSWLRAVEDHVRDLLEKENPVPGWKLVPKRARRKWVSEEEALRVLDELDIPEEDRYTRKLVSPAQAEKAIKKHYPPGLNRPKLPEEAYEKKSSGTNVVPDDDPRAGIDATGEAERFFSAD